MAGYGLFVRSRLAPVPELVKRHHALNALNALNALSGPVSEAALAGKSALEM
jgi:hypothetical protein